MLHDNHCYYAVYHPRNFANEYTLYKFGTKQDRTEYYDDNDFPPSSSWKDLTYKDAMKLLGREDVYNKKYYYVSKSYHIDEDQGYCWRKSNELEIWEMEEECS